MIELLDVLDFDGRFTGITKSRAEIHRDGDWHRAAHLWLVTPGDRVLLQRRAFSKDSWPGLWDVSVAGHVAAGESAQDAVIRETREELGIAVAATDLTHLGTLRYRAVLERPALPYIENEFHEVYLLRRELDLSSLTLDPVEVADAALVAPDEMASYDLVPHEESYALLRAQIG